MALSLKDLKKDKKTSVLQTLSQQKKVLRPWESYDQSGNQTRTLRAKEAVLKSQQKVDQKKTEEFPTSPSPITQGQESAILYEENLPEVQLAEITLSTHPTLVTIPQDSLAEILEENTEGGPKFLGLQELRPFLQDGTLLHEGIIKDESHKDPPLGSHEKFPTVQRIRTPSIPLKLPGFLGLLYYFLTM